MKKTEMVKHYIDTLLMDDRSSVYFVGVKSEPRFKELTAIKIT